MDSKASTGWIQQQLIYLCAYYQTQFPDRVLAMYAEDLADLPQGALLQAFQDIRRDPKVTRFPLPAMIRARVAPSENLDDRAAEIASRIPEALSRFGWNNPKKAREFVGEIAWEIIAREGGWQRVCEMVQDETVSVYKAQWRGLARALLNRRPGSKETELIDHVSAQLTHN
jgi:hypothetical protein